MSSIEIHEGRYLTADSLLTAATELQPPDLYTLAAHQSVKEQIDFMEQKDSQIADLTARLERLEALMGVTGGDSEGGVQ